MKGETKRPITKADMGLGSRESSEIGAISNFQGGQKVEHVFLPESHLPSPTKEWNSYLLMLYLTGYSDVKFVDNIFLSLKRLKSPCKFAVQ